MSFRTLQRARGKFHVGLGVIHLATALALEGFSHSPERRKAQATAQARIRWADCHATLGRPVGQVWASQEGWSPIYYVLVKQDGASVYAQTPGADFLSTWDDEDEAHGVAEALLPPGRVVGYLKATSHNRFGWLTPVEEGHRLLGLLLGTIDERNGVPSAAWPIVWNRGLQALIGAMRRARRALAAMGGLTPAPSDLRERSGLWLLVHDRPTIQATLRLTKAQRMDLGVQDRSAVTMAMDGRVYRCAVRKARGSTVNYLNARGVALFYVRDADTVELGLSVIRLGMQA